MLKHFTSTQILLSYFNEKSFQLIILCSKRLKFKDSKYPRFKKIKIYELSQNKQHFIVCVKIPDILIIVCFLDSRLLKNLLERYLNSKSFLRFNED